MQDKIRFYEEMMALEPGSKLFFPFAKMLMDGGRYEHARSVLEQGLNAHPEFMEARLLLLDVLHHLGLGDEANQQGQKIIRLLGRYQGFWTSWENSLEVDNDRDLLLALRFVRSALQGNPLRWVDILDRGCSQLLQGLAAAGGPDREKDPCSDRDFRDAGKSLQGATQENGLQEVPASPGLTDDPAEARDTEVVEGEIDVPGQKGISEGDTAHWEPCDLEEATSLVDSEPSGDPAACFAKDEPANDQDADEVEAISIDPDVRTKTMADLLMKQEEYSQALEIYQELWKSCPPGQDRHELEQAMNEARQRLAQGHEETGILDSVPSDPLAGQETDEVVKTLSALADRLDERSKS
ncbi:hypothetical protein [Desulfoplanes formicivorans]|uniref:Tetratricopeptide repeat protein n=1 Tax=Desulfoplanes formicivorans TaxID=1592317 RepID=A0A194AFJ6_9BACT|nr:hypothetical protein [Desulfoplanes formicivorans]GAU07861.1 hypothetical protein DPF_0560 [Desulfoplanes formicivorans]